MNGPIERPDAAPLDVEDQSVLDDAAVHHRLDGIEALLALVVERLGGQDG